MKSESNGVYISFVAIFDEKKFWLSIWQSSFFFSSFSNRANCSGHETRMYGRRVERWDTKINRRCPHVFHERWYSRIENSILEIIPNNHVAKLRQSPRHDSQVKKKKKTRFQYLNNLWSYERICDFFSMSKYIFVRVNLHSFTSKYTKIALKRIKEKSGDEPGELSLLERILKLDGNENEKTATILALDLFLVGIDTVSFFVTIRTRKKRSNLSEKYFSKHSNNLKKKKN